MILNEFFNLPQVFEKDMTEDQSQYTDMTVAQQVFKDNPDIDHEDDILNAAFPYVVELVGSRKRANYMFNYDEDFPGDLISAYRYLQRDQHDVGLEEGVAEGIFDRFKEKPPEEYDIYLKGGYDPHTVKKYLLGKFGSRGWRVSSDGMENVVQVNIDASLYPSELEAKVDLRNAKQGVAEAKDDYVPPKEADYGPEYQAMVRRVGQKAKQQEKAKQQPPKQPVRESRRALLKQIIQS